jgi:hypothetical protein
MFFGIAIGHFSARILYPIDVMKRTILFLGLIIAVLVLANNFGHADTNINLKDHALSQQTEHLAMDILKSIEADDNLETIFKIYNSTDQLVYETRDRTDKKLLQLMKSSDFITEVDKTSYYKLSR